MLIMTVYNSSQTSGQVKNAFLSIMTSCRFKCWLMYYGLLMFIEERFNLFLRDLNAVATTIQLRIYLVYRFVRSIYLRHMKTCACVFVWLICDIYILCLRTWASMFSARYVRIRFIEFLNWFNSTCTSV